MQPVYSRYSTVDCWLYARDWRVERPEVVGRLFKPPNLESWVSSRLQMSGLLLWVVEAFLAFDVLADSLHVNTTRIVEKKKLSIGMVQLKGDDTDSLRPDGRTDSYR